MKFHKKRENSLFISNLLSENEKLKEKIKDLIGKIDKSDEKIINISIQGSMNTILDEKSLENRENTDKIPKNSIDFSEENFRNLEKNYKELQMKYVETTEEFEKKEMEEMEENVKNIDKIQELERSLKNLKNLKRDFMIETEEKIKFQLKYEEIEKKWLNEKREIMEKNEEIQNLQEKIMEIERNQGFFNHNLFLWSLSGVFQCFFLRR